MVVVPFLVMGGTPDARAMGLAICGATVMTLLVSAGTVSWSFLRAGGRLRDGMLALLRVNGWMLLAAFAMLGGRLDVWLVGILGNPVQAGLYGVAAQLCVGVGIVTQALVTTALPSVSRFQTAGEVRDFLVRSTRLLLPLFVLPLVAWPIAGPVIGGVFGVAYAGSAGAFTVLLLAAIMTLAGAPLMLVLLSLGEARVMAYGALAQFALRVALAVPMVPAWGAVGLGVADVASRLIAMAAISHFIWRALRRQMVPAVVAP
jgi:O-antigen/teichoic acid export membrane protein